MSSRRIGFSHQSCHVTSRRPMGAQSAHARARSVGAPANSKASRLQNHVRGNFLTLDSALREGEDGWRSGIHGLSGKIIDCPK